MLCLVKHSYPDIANSLHEISKVLDRAYPAAFKEMIHVIKFGLDAKNYGLKFAPNLDEYEIWNLLCYSNIDCAGDPDCVSSYILFMKNLAK